ncbi:MAG TPA: FRG domain-containing protein [Gallionella sp.]|nr:FRG domain-containing protein [Gallionella sp.]
MKRFTLTDLEKLHLVFRGYRSHDGLANWFRGQADSDWELLPKAGRREYRLPNNRDLGRFNSWCGQAIAYCTLPVSQLEQLALAQHHGLATRLLDWTKNPLVACYFACCELPSVDGAVYIYEIPEKLFTEQSTIDQIREQQGVFGYIPNAIAPRVLNQKGLFTVHCDATQPIGVAPSRMGNGEPNLVQIVIPAKLKKEVLILLDDYGVDRSMLFPDLDGLSSHINSHTARMKRHAFD